MPGNVKTRERKLPGPTFKFTNRRTGLTGSGGVPSPDQVINYPSYSVPGKQITVSEGHDWPPITGDPLTDRGGDFFTSKTFVASPRVSPYSELRSLESNGVSSMIFEGSVIPQVPGLDTDSAWPTNVAISDSELDAKGATAIKRCKPGDPIMSLSTTLGELVKDGIPSILGKGLWESRTRQQLQKGVGGEYLNYTFGYKPIVSDIMRFSDIMSRTHTLLEQYERDAGRVVRRQYRFPIERASSESTIHTLRFPQYVEGIPRFGEYNHPMSLVGNVVRRVETLRRIWFSGAFTYYLPSDYNSRSELASLAEKANVLLGLKLTPETLWNLAPWSWAADWFANTGDVLSNLSSFRTNGLVMHYGYIMCHTMVTHTYSHQPTANYANRPGISDIVLVCETKQRKRANPFGFGIGWDDLSSSQLAIAAALGISRR